MTYFRFFSFQITIVLGLSLLFVSCKESPPKVREIDKPAVSKQPQPKGDAARRLFFEERCSSGHGGMCGELGIMFEKGYGGPKDKQQAHRYLKMACNQGVLKACDALGQKMTPADSLAIYTKQCQKQNPFACNNQGHILWLGKDLPKDEVAARKALGKGCSGGISASCFGLAKMWTDGIGGDKNLDTAQAYLKKGTAALQIENKLKLKYGLILAKEDLPVGKLKDSVIDQLLKSPKTDETNMQIQQPSHSSDNKPAKPAETKPAGTVEEKN